ncbi:MAG TPA: hypothetical protein VF715_08955, partial [Thermoleophilaceae bacterium]
ASAAGCSKSGYKTLDQSKYIVLQRGPVPKGDSTSDYGFYACRIRNGKRYTLGGQECFGNDLGRIGDYALAGNFIAYERYVCGLAEGEARAESLNVATGKKAKYEAEQGPLDGTDGLMTDYSITDIVITSKGNMAWIAFLKHNQNGQTRYDVRRAIDGTADRVDFGPNIVADSLGYSSGNIFWLNGNVAKSASLPTN